MTLCAERRGAGPLVIDDVVQKADVSRGTFYKYFDSVDALVEELGRSLVDDLVKSLRRLVAGHTDPLMRISVGNCALFMRASIDPAWGGFVVHTVFVSDAKTIVGGMRQAIEDGCRAGLLMTSNIEVATDFHIGLALQGIRRLIRTGFDERYILDAASLALSGLGVDREKAAELARSSMNELFAVGPATLPWWPDDLALAGGKAANVMSRAEATPRLLDDQPDS